VFGASLRSVYYNRLCLGVLTIERVGSLLVIVCVCVLEVCVVSFIAPH
jgi:hypothetical protein